METDTEKLLRAIISRKGGCPSHVSDGPKFTWSDCGYPDCRESMCDFWQTVDAMREQIDAGFIVISR